MPQRIQTDPAGIQNILDVIFSQNRPPVARCRLLSSGFGPGHMLQITEDIQGTKACLGCGCCIDTCPVLARDPNRRLRTDARTSMALETLIEADCDRCGSCVLVCPQVDPSIKAFVVRTYVAEGMGALLEKATTDEIALLELALYEVENR